MDGKGARRDNVFVERLWRSVRYEEVYLQAYASVSKAHGSIGQYLAFYDERRPYSSRDGRAHPTTTLASLVDEKSVDEASAGILVRLRRSGSK